MILDFVELAESARERDLEAALLNDIERFMLALGEGFCFAGRQRSLQVGGEEFVLDLLFYHHPTRRFVVVDLKVGPFRAEFAGKMSLYVNAVNELIAHDPDRATVGFILCTDRDKTVAQLALQGIATPIAITRYTIGKQGVEMTGEEAEITKASTRRWSRCAASSSESPSSRRGERANSPTALARATGPDQRPRVSVRLKRSRAGQERWALRQAGGNPQRWHETVQRDDQNPAVDPLQTTGAHDAQDRECPARAPALPAAVKPERHLSNARDVTRVEHPRLGLDRESDAGRGDRDRVDVSSSSPRQRVAQPPTFTLEPRERPLDLVLRAGADPAAARKRQPATRVHAERHGAAQQQPARGHRSGAGREESQHRDGCGSCRGHRCTHQPPVLLPAGEIHAAPRTEGLAGIEVLVDRDARLAAREHVLCEHELPPADHLDPLAQLDR